MTGRLEDVVVVGGSVAGYRTASALRRRGYDGRLRMVSAEPLDNYYRPALSKGFLGGDQEEANLVLPISDDLGLDVWSGVEATALDPVSRRLTVGRGGESVELAYDGLVIATGLAPRRLPLPDLAGIHYVRELADARRLRSELAAGPRVVVIGGGLVGCETAATCRGLGLDVTVVDIADRLLEPVLGSAVATIVTDLHRAHGVQVRTGVGLAGVHGHGRVESVTLSDGTQLPADVVVVAVGSVPRTGWLSGSGLHLADGVLCAGNLGVLGAESVVAVGDVARIEAPNGTTVRIEHWENAVRQADAAARTLLEGNDAPPFTAHTMFWSTQYTLQIHVLGRPSAGDGLHLLEGCLEDLDATGAYHWGDRVTGIVTLNGPARLRAHRHLLDGALAVNLAGGKS